MVTPKLLLLIAGLSCCGCFAQAYKAPETITLEQIETGDPIALCKGLPSFTSAELEARDERECKIRWTAPPCERIRPAEAYAIFTGKVTKIEAVDSHFLLDGKCSKTGSQTVSMTITSSFIGQALGTVTIHAGDLNGFYFNAGEHYLVVAKRLVDGSLTVTSCGGTVPLKEATEELAFLRSWGDRPKAATVSGDVWVPADARQSERMVTMSRPMVYYPVSFKGPRSGLIATDDKGHFTIPELPPGRYEINLDVPFPTWPAKRQSVELVERGCAQVDFHVNPLGVHDQR